MNRTIFWGITYRQLLLILSFYALAALFYDVALSISQQPWSDITLADNLMRELPHILLDYGLKLLFTIPVWYLLFVRLRHWPLARRVALHAILLPLFILIWQSVYYVISDGIGWGRLRDSGQIWDTYIGALFYLVQFGIFHAYAYYRDLQQQRIREIQLRELAVKSELTALKAQLNPHFLYNVFNTISASVPPAQERTRELLAELADLFRYQLQASRSDEATVRDEINFVRKYLDLEKARFGDRLRVHFDVADDALDCLLPPMLLQPLVENSVRHGIGSLIDGGEVRVSTHRQNGQLCIEIADTGVGMNGSTETGNGVGLTNTRLRLEKMHEAELLVSPNQPQGVVVRFSIPVKVKKNSHREAPGRPEFHREISFLFSLKRPLRISSHSVHLCGTILISEMQKVIIIDDEAAGRILIREYLAAYPALIVVGEANNGVDAVRLINEFKPDLIFLDIQMPGLTGFDVLTHLDEIPQIIFSTAYDQYALRAFEVHAVDYLLKPYTQSRFAQAIEHVTDSRTGNLQKLQPLAESLLTATATYPEKILVQTGNRLVTVSVTDILRIEAEGDYATLVTATGKHLSNYGIGALEAKLNPQYFLRVHRSDIVNLHYIREIQSTRRVMMSSCKTAT